MTPTARTIVSQTTTTYTESTPYGPYECRAATTYRLIFWPDGSFDLDCTYTVNGIVRQSWREGGANAAARLSALQAEALGRAACAAGAPNVPALDPQLRALLAGNKIGEGRPVLAAWLRGWGEASLAADGTTDDEADSDPGAAWDEADELALELDTRRAYTLPLED